MPLNVPKNYAFVPKPVGPVKLVTHSSTRARLVAGGTYFRSIEYGEAANLIKFTIVEDLSVLPNEGKLIVQHTIFKPAEQVAVANMPLPTHELLDLTLNWDEEIRLTKGVDGRVSASKYGIRWQTAGGETLLAEYGQVTPGKLFIVPGTVAIKVAFVAADWPTTGVFYLRPRTHRYTLVPISVTDPMTMLSTTGWDPDALRASVVADTWFTMPARAPASDPMGPPVFPAPHGADVQDTGSDATFLTAFALTPLKGGDGLPIAPVGFNTGPDRVMVHLNYAEKADGSMGELNQVFEWVGSSAALGAWGRYS